MFPIHYIVGVTALALLAAVIASIRHRNLLREYRRTQDSNWRLQSDLERAGDWRSRAEARLNYLEEGFRVRQARYSMLFNNATDMTFIYGVTDDFLPGKFIEVNDAACESLERPRKELLKLTPLDIEETIKENSMVRLYSRTELVTLSDAEISYRRSTSDRQLMKQILNSAEVHYERVYVSGKGKRIPVEIRARCYEMDGEHLILCTAHDLTDRKKSERVLREGQQRLRDLLAYSPIGAAVYDGSCKLVDINASCLRMFGVPDEEAFAKVNLFDNPFTPEDVRGKLSRKEATDFEAVFDFDEVRRSGMFVSDRVGRVYFYIVMIDLGLDADYNPKGYIFQIQDVTQRRTAEMALLEKERELRQSQKLEAIGSLASGIAHDFNNILTPIMGYTDLIMESAPQSDTLSEYMSEILTASHRAKDLVDQILTFSRRSDQEDVRLRVTPIIKEVLKLTRTAAGASIDVRRSLRAANDAVCANPVQIHQVLMNLCTNATHAMRETGGILEVLTSNITAQHGTGDNGSGLAPGRYLRVSIRDTGCGMSSDATERIFEPFFTTKGVGEGTGMGLAVVHGIVTALRGKVTVDSTPGEGTVFHVFLPTVEKVDTAPVETRSNLPRGTERLLVVDDEQAVLRMLKTMLCSLGYEVDTRDRPVEALAVFQDDPGRYDLLITDHRMPEMSGAELAGRVFSVRPDFPVIMCTGFSEEFAPRDGSELGIREFIMKPIVVRSLSEAVRRALDGKGAKAEPALLKT